MKRSIVRILLTAIAFAFILPLIPGINFYGNFGIAIVAALAFAVIAWLVDLIAIALSAFFAITTFGLALLVLIPLWLIAFWMLPAISLKVLADVMPAHLTVAGWIPAIEGALVILLIGMCTGRFR